MPNPCELTFGGASLQGGPFVQGKLACWEWSRNGGEYENHRDFFSVHWEVQKNQQPEAVRLHVESPTASVDPSLNAIKRQIVESILASPIGSELCKKGYGFAHGPRINSAPRTKSTEAFRVVLRSSQSTGSIEGDIELVHREIGGAVSQVVEKYRNQLSSILDQ